MKKKFLSISINAIRKKYPNYDDLKLDEIAYGLEAIYLTITKLVIMITLAIYLNILKEMLFLLFVYNIIRVNAFGLHATRSIYCLISSLSLFIGGVYLCKYLNIPLIIKILLSLILIVCIYKYAPADTEKRPLINSKKRHKYKILSTASSIILSICIIIFNNSIISNYLLIGMLEAVLMILPFIYKLFHMPYNNYKSYIQ